MPIELHIHAARPLDDDVSSERIIERSDQNIGPCRTGGVDGRVHVCHQITCALQPKRIWDGRLEAEYGHATYWCEDQLRHRAALGRSYCKDSLLGRCAAKCRKQTRDEAIEIFRSHVDMCRVVLRPYSHAYGFGCLRSLGKSTDVRRSDR